MDVNVKLTAEKGLLSVLDRIAKALEGKVVFENHAVASPEVTQINDCEAAAVSVMATTADLTTASDGKKYDMFQEMCDVFDVLINKGRNQDVKDILAKYSANGEYGGVSPKDWGKAIAMAKDLAKEPQTKPEQIIEKQYTLEEVRELARKVQLSKGKETLHKIFQDAGKSKLTDFDAGEYASLYQQLQEVM